MGRMTGVLWFRRLWGTPRKHASVHQNAGLGVLAFEVASLMSKLVHLWQSLSDENIVRLREEIADSVGMKKLVSEDDLYFGRLIYAEMIENIKHISKSVSRIAKKCCDPTLQKFEALFEDLMVLGVDPYGWKLTWKKMERKIKRMERLIAANVSLYQEMEALGDLEQILKRMKNNDGDLTNLVECQKKVAWKQHEVKTLREVSLWSKSHDYVVNLLAQAIFTAFYRVKFAFGIQQIADIAMVKDNKVLKTNLVAVRRQSLSLLLQSSVHPLENGLPRFSSGAIGMSTKNLTPFLKARKAKNFSSGPLGGFSAKTSLAPETDMGVGFYTGPMSKITRSGPLFIASKVRRALGWGHDQSSALDRRKSNPKHVQSCSVGPTGGIMGVSSDGVRTGNVETSKDIILADIDGSTVDGRILSFSSKCKTLNAPLESLGSAGLALHYANVIIQIEKLASTPHLISLDARDDLYDMLPASVRTLLRSRLKPYAKSLASLAYDAALASEWSETMTGILEWLAPLAHNMIRWQTEWSYEQQNLGSRNNVLLVQTLFFANQDKTEAVITELLVGLNYIWRVGRDLNARTLVESACSGQLDEDSDLEE
ncbi:hypothetical protein MLD38_019011 [Melastoma candidum]|uniref:Uncharacterized protein n=1 Tax=Melastoma candidum TaxID=119954 RepID=A0ACB9QXI2_9MYRT|nr:hypothetical protein MLD38_019011 [Melastoma candidum]